MSALRRRLLDRLADLKPNTTMCPGQLALECGTTLREAREDILALARAGKIKLSQRGNEISGENLKGPFRVKLRR
jgi:hypothetical protein